MNKFLMRVQTLSGNARPYLTWESEIRIWSEKIREYKVSVQ